MFFAENVEIKKKEIQVPVQEKYFGKDRDTKALEDEFKNLINKKGNYNCSKIEKILEKKFGFHKVTVLIDNTVNELNAYTFCDYDESRKISIKNGEYKLQPNNEYKVYIYYTRGILSGVLSPAELVAITLHEVGHHFSLRTNIINLNTKMLQILVDGVLDIQKAFKVSNSPDTTDGDRILNTIKIFAYLTVPGLLWIFVFFNVLILFASMMDGAVTAITSLDMLLTPEGRNKLFRLVEDKFKDVFIRVQLHDPEEERSDSFSTIYGYAPELASALGKIEGNMLNQSPAIKMLQRWWTVPLYMIIGLFDPKAHGIQSARRIGGMVATLSKELKDSSNNNKEINQVIKDLNAVEDKYAQYLEDRIEENDSKRALPPLADVANVNVWRYILRNKRDLELLSYESLRKLILPR